jgi:hypothetical protein
MARPQHTGRDFEHPRERGRIANCTNALWTVAHISPEVLCSAKCARQRLTLLRRTELSTVTLRVRSTVYGGPNRARYAFALPIALNP